MDIRPEIRQAITEMGFVDLTEIQKQTIPLLLEGRDVIGHSHTGTGKTAAYGIPILQMLDFDLDTVQTLVIAPTRELAVQIHDEIGRIAKYLEKCRIVTVFGGDPIGRQIIALKKRPQIVVGTPGRMIDHIQRKTLKIHDVRYLILDEADEMLKMGFQEDIETILQETPPNRQTLMFSATMPKPILSLAKKYMIDPELIRVIGSEETSSDIIQQYYKVKRENKTEALYRLINIYRPKLSLVFCNTKAKVDELTQEMIERGVNCDKIHGDLPQTTRLDVLKKFHNGIIDVMIATDVAARGLDIKAVEAVFNYDVPEKADYYIHRIGRTGRIGHLGYSFTLVSRGEMRLIEEIERLIKVKIKKRSIPTYEKVQDVKHDKMIETIQEMLGKENFEKEYLFLNKAIQAKLTEDQIIVSLLKMLVREDKEGANVEDINEEFASVKPKTGAKEGANTSRFHLNLGKNADLTVSDILDFVCSKVPIERREVRDIAILTEFTFFTVPSKVADDVMTKLNNQKLKGRRVFLSVSRKPKHTFRG
jgi:ATP-dependent RNA helicase DeaD